MSSQFIGANNEPLDLNNLLEEHKALVVRIVKKFNPKPHLYDEYLQVGMIGLWKALQKFQPSRGYQFSTYAWYCILRHIYHHIKKENRYCHRHETIDNDVAYIAKNDLIESIPSYLSKSEKCILEDRLSNMTLQEIASKRNYKKNFVSKQLNNAINKIRIANHNEV